MVKKARAAGSFIGGILGNPFIVLGGIVLGALILFRKDIRGAFAGLGEGIGDINIQLPEIKFPEITFPEITFPEFPAFEFPDFSSIFQGFQDQLSALAGQTVTVEGGAQVMIPPDTTVDPETGVVTSETPPTITGVTPTEFGLLRPKVFDTLINLGLTPSEAFARLKDATTILDLDAILQTFNTPFIPPDTPSGDFDTTVLNLLGTEQEFTGGGVGFMGGVVNPTPITTLTQVIDLFPNITSSQAADFLAEFSGILPEAALQQGFDVINISGDPNQPILDQPSSLGTTGISPQELFKLLFPNIISNF